MSNIVVSYDYPASERTNIPTAETSTMMKVDDLADKEAPATETEATAEEESEKKEDTRYPTLRWRRDSSGEKRGAAGPLFLHDKVDPFVFVQSLFADAGQVHQIGFDATNGFRDEKGEPAVDAGWFPYKYKGNWSNRLIRAPGQRAMASMLAKENMRGEVNLIYMDPPYNISFRSNFQVRSDLPETGETLDDVPNDAPTIKAFRDTYRNGIHSYLDGLREQLILARELLADDGSFIMQIGPDNLHYAALVMGEVFGMENHVATIPYQTTRMESKRITEIGNWLIWYEKTKGGCKYRQLYEKYSSRSEYLEMVGGTGWIETPTSDGGVKVEKLTAEHRRNLAVIPSDARIYSERDIQSAHASSTGRSDPFYLHPDGKPCPEHADAWDGHSCSDNCDKNTRECPFGRKCGNRCHANAYPCRAGRQWSVSHRGIHSIALQGRMHFGTKGQIKRKHYENDNPGRSVNALWASGGKVENKQYIVETPSRVLDRCVLMTTDPGDLVLDLTCGSGAMPVAAERWGRRWIACDVSAVSVSIARERVASTVFPNHMLKDSEEGARLDHELEMQMLPTHMRTPFVPREYGADPALGFVNERQMRVSAGTLAYGPDFSKDVIRHPDRLRRSKRKWRAASAFTVETTSPYRAYTPEELAQNGFAPNGENGGVIGESNPLRERIIESLSTAGVRDERMNARYGVDNLQPVAWTSSLTHTGVMANGDGRRVKAAFYIGAEDETISRHQIKYAAQAVQESLGGVEILCMVGFGRDANALKYDHPTLTILNVAANRDLQLAGLDKKEDDDAFMVVSEPEVRLHRTKSGEVQIEVLGLNCFNPETGIIESRDAKRRIAGVMVDVNYDGESFKARLMNVIANSRNQKTLRDLRKAFPKIDDDRFAMMTSSTTLPFALPERGVKVAVKVVDLTGMEHMAVIDDPRDPEWYKG